MSWEDFLWGYLVPEFQELEFRIEDLLLHTYTGFFVAIVIRIKKIYNWFKNKFKKLMTLKIKFIFFKKPKNIFIF